MGFFEKKAPVVNPPDSYMVIGKVGNTFGNSDVQRKFNSSAISSGMKGEQILFHKLRNHNNGWIPADMPVFCSLILPGYSSDIDFAVCRGNKVLLIDAKMYKQSGGFFWNLGFDESTINHNFSRYKSRGGKNIKLSRSMVAARDIIQRNLNGFHVQSVVVMTTDNSNRNAKIPNTTFLKFPGGIKTLNDRTAPRYIRKFFAGEKRTMDTVNAEIYLKRITQT